MEILIITVLIVALWFFLIPLSKNFKSFINPVTVFVLFNTFSLCLAVANVENYDSLSVEVYLVYFSDIVLLFLGATAAERTRITLNGRTKPTNNVDAATKFITITGTIGIVGEMILLRNIIHNFGLSFIIVHPAILQKNFQVLSGIGYMNTLNILVLPGIVYALVIKKEKKKRYLLFALTSVIGLVLAGNKTYISVCILTSLFVWVIFQKKVSSIVPKVIVVIFGVIAYFNWYTRVIDIGAKFGENRFSGVMLYLTGSWVALGKMLETKMRSPSPGFYTLYFIYKIIGALRHESIGSNFMDFVSISPTRRTNVYTANGEFYSDFGLAGILIGFLLLGFFSHKAKINWERNNYSVINTVLYSLMLTNIAMTFFVNYFIQPYMVINYIYLLLFLAAVNLKVIK